MYTWAIAASLVWILLHSLDHFLTLVSAQVYKAGANQVFDFGGSFELNPVMQKPIDQNRWLSKRFLLSITVFTAAIGYVAHTAVLQGDVWLAQALIGFVVFHKVPIVWQHVSTISMFQRIKRIAGSITGHIRYDRRTVLFITARVYFGYAIVVSIAAGLTLSPWVIGGALGLFGVSSYMAVLGLRSKQRSQTTQPAQPASVDASAELAVQ
jgi:hypothetical protein